MFEENNYYTCLGLPIDATDEEIRRAYRDAARRLHPDHNQQPGETQLFLDIHKAYEVLSNHKKRAEYDRTLPPSLTTPPEIRISTQYSRSSLHQSTSPQVIYVLVEMETTVKHNQITSPPLNICLVLDTSTSMQGSTLDTVKATAMELISQLKEQDVFSLVTFNDNAQVVIPAGGPGNGDQLKNSIRMLRASGGTEIFKGLKTGYQEVLKQRRSNHINHLILLTDGRTYGDEPDCLNLAEKAAIEGIGISALGIGSKWNDNFLDKLTSLTGGSSNFISRPGEIAHLLKQQVSRLEESYVDRVIYSFRQSDGVKLNYGIRLQPEAAPLEISSPIQLGAIPYQSSLSILFEFIIEALPEAINEQKLTQGMLTCEIPSKDIPKATLRLNLSRVVTNQPVVETPPLALTKAVSRMTLYRMQDRAQHDLASGNVEEATRRLQHLATHLLSQGEHDLAKTVMEEANNLERYETLSEEGKKNIKYGTRALLWPGTLSEIAKRILPTGAEKKP
jgi:Ca-activated chloride channel homolog